MVAVTEQHIARYWSKLKKQSFLLALNVIVHISVNMLIKQELHCNASDDAALLHATILSFGKEFVIRFFIATRQQFLFILATIRNDSQFLG